MEVRAILIAGGGSEAEAESFSGYPFALLDVLGKPAITRLAERLTQFGIERCSVVVDSAEMPPPLRRSADSARMNWKLARGSEDFWRACEQTFSEFAHDGAELVVVHRVGPYLELNYEELIQFHLDHHGRVTQVRDSAGHLGTFVVSASRRNDAAFLFRHRLQDCRTDCVDYSFAGYRNRLQSPDNFRQIVRDALLRNNQIAPVGNEVRPGIWMGRRARVERGARLVAPCYVGERARVRTAAVITRTSSLERHSEADCGAIVEDSTLLPFSKLGAGLDCSHSVAGFQKIAHLARGVEVEIPDRRLLAMRPPLTSRRAAAGAVSMAALAGRMLSAMFASNAEPPRYEEARAEEEQQAAPNVAQQQKIRATG